MREGREGRMAYKSKGVMGMGDLDACRSCLS